MRGGRQPGRNARPLQCLRSREGGNELFLCHARAADRTGMIAPKLLVVTPCVPNGLPTQGSIIAERLRREGVAVEVLSRARTSVGRVLDVFCRGVWLLTRYRTVLVDV